jgi:hypothetical protein
VAAWRLWVLASRDLPEPLSKLGFVARLMEILRVKQAALAQGYSPAIADISSVFDSMWLPVSEH